MKKKRFSKGLPELDFPVIIPDVFPDNAVWLGVGGVKIGLLITYTTIRLDTVYTAEQLKAEIRAAINLGCFELQIYWADETDTICRKWIPKEMFLI